MSWLFQVFVLLTLTSGFKANTVTKDTLTYFLFNKENPNEPILLDYKNSNEYLSYNTEVIFLIHGWTQNHNHQSLRLLKNAFLSRDDKSFDVIEVDYGDVAAQVYWKTIQDATKVGEFLGDFLIHMEQKGLSLERIHLVGHSLGAHVAGYAGKHVSEKLGRKIQRITGLDPAGPFFDGIVVTNHNKLTRKDAEVVVIIHTDRTMFGLRSSSGTVDIYPNGGANQPGCPDYYRGEILFCSHHKSYELFADAVANPGTMIATRCTSYAAFDDGECTNNRKIDVGGVITTHDDGDYYLHTNAKKPYGKGH